MNQISYKYTELSHQILTRNIVWVAVGENKLLRIFFQIIDTEGYENIQYIEKHSFFKLMSNKKKYPSGIDYDFHQYQYTVTVLHEWVRFLYKTLVLNTKHKQLKTHFQKSLYIDSNDSSSSHSSGYGFIVMQKEFLVY